MDLLNAGCHNFVKEFQSVAGFDPMENCITIASACNRYWRKRHLKPKTVAVEPPRGWKGAQVNQSKKAQEWLLWNEYLLPSMSPSKAAPRIQHVRNGGEQLIPATPSSFHVDGLDWTTNTVYEFHGCLFRGCRTCYKDRNQIPFSSAGRSMEALYQATLQKTQTLRSMGYTVHEMWECQWNGQIKSSPDLQVFLSSLDIIPPLNLRDAFFGGRTGAASLYRQADDTQGEEIRYVDLMSEKPWSTSMAHTR